MKKHFKIFAIVFSIIFYTAVLGHAILVSQGATGVSPIPTENVSSLNVLFLLDASGNKIWRAQSDSFGNLAIAPGQNSAYMGVSVFAGSISVTSNISLSGTSDTNLKQISGTAISFVAGSTSGKLPTGLFDALGQAIVSSNQSATFGTGGRGILTTGPTYGYRSAISSFANIGAKIDANGDTAMTVECASCAAGTAALTATGGVNINLSKVANVNMTPATALNAAQTNADIGLLTKSQNMGQLSGGVPQVINAQPMNASAMNASMNGLAVAAGQYGLIGTAWTPTGAAIDSSGTTRTTTDIYANKLNSQCISFTAANLGISLPLSLTTSNSLTFTVNMDGYNQIIAYIDIQVTATATAGSCGITPFPLDESGNFLNPMASLIGVTATGIVGPGAVGLKLLTFTATVTPFDNFLTCRYNFGNLIQGSINLYAPDQTSTANALNGLFPVAPKVMIAIINRLNATGFVFYIKSIVVYLRNTI